jgi:hypothetical protein
MALGGEMWRYHQYGHLAIVMTRNESWLAKAIGVINENGVNKMAGGINV